MIHITPHRISIGSWGDYQDAAAGNPPGRFQIIVSVCDQPPSLGPAGLQLYWYPINELSQWGYGPFYWSKRILDHHTRRGDSILVHCAAGAHRSPMIVFTWLMSLQVAAGQPPDFEAINGLMGDDYADLYLSDVRRGTIPADLETLYQAMQDPRLGLTDCLEQMKRHRAH